MCASVYTDDNDDHNNAHSSIKYHLISGGLSIIDVILNPMRIL